VTFTMTLSPVAPGAGTPSGQVNFRIDGSIMGTGTLSGGVAAFAANTLTRGLHTVAAEYAGDMNFIGVTNNLGAGGAHRYAARRGATSPLSAIRLWA